MIDQRSRHTRALAAAILLSSLTLLAGCWDRQKIEAEYGKREGDSSGRSVNGTGVLARMFESAGVKVRTTKRLGRSLQRAQVLVWVPNRFRPPDDDVREFIEDWLHEEDGRTLIYVGRDYDASVAYWEKSLPTMQPEKQFEARKRLAKRQAEFAKERSGFPLEEDCDWFTLDRNAAERTVQTLEGPWSQGIDPQKVDMRLYTRLGPSEMAEDEEGAGYGLHGAAEFEALLTSDDEVLIGRYHRQNWRDSQILVMANGSWLLNLPLVNHEHRKLAARVIAACGSPDRAVFLESGPGEPPLLDEAPNQHHGLAAFTVWPVNCILMHLTLLGLLLCFSIFPIFGRPRELDETEVSDFGKHVEAMGDLMARTEDRQFARERREYYQQRVAGDGSQGIATPVTVAPVVSVVELSAAPVTMSPSTGEAAAGEQSEPGPT